MTARISQLVLALFLTVLLAGGAFAQEGSIAIGDGATGPMNQSKPFFHNGTWWAVLLNAGDHYIHRLDGDTFTKLADGFVDSRNSALGDVLFNGSDLFVIMGHGTESRFYKFNYAAGTNSFVLVAGFPVVIPLGDGYVAPTVAQDGTGKLWIAHRISGDIKVQWSTSADHQTWDTTGFVLQSGVFSNDKAAVVSFDGQIGVLWSDQSGGDFGFRAHTDGAAESTWSAKEIVSDLPGIADDHLNVAPTPAGEVIAATKDGFGTINMFVRDTSGTWGGPFFVAGSGTRPIVVFNDENLSFYCFYTDVNVAPFRIVYKSAPLADVGTLASVPPREFLAFDGISLNDVTSTKQSVDSTTGLLAIARSGAFAYYKVLDFTAPSARIVASVTAGGTPLEVQFMADAEDFDGTIVSYEWDFGGGDTSTEKNPKHTFEDAGIHAVSLTVTDNDGKTGMASIDIIASFQPEYDDAKINFQLGGVPIPAGYAEDNGAAFDILKGYGWDRTILGREYDSTGDQRLDTYVFIDNDEAPAVWNYVVPSGTYEIDVTAGSPAFTGQHKVDVEGILVIDNVATAAGEFVDVTGQQIIVGDGTITVTIGGGSQAARKTKISYLHIRLVELAEEEVAPEASASADKLSGEAPLVVQFTGSATDEDGTIESYEWNFGNGDSSNEQSPEYTFMAAGTYQVTCTVTDDDGLIDEDTLTIVVSEPTHVNVWCDAAGKLRKLVQDGDLSRRRGFALGWRLYTAKYLYDRGYTSYARYFMKSFKRKLRRYVYYGVLSAEKAAPLRECANDILDLLDS